MQQRTTRTQIIRTPTPEAIRPSPAVSKPTVKTIPHALPPLPPPTQPLPSKLKWDRLWTALALISWYICGNYTIITAKLLLTDWNVPPLLLTLQQLIVSSLLLFVILHYSTTNHHQGIQPLPWERRRNSKLSKQEYVYFLLVGLFNAMDFLATNAGFSGSAASFVETIKSSEAFTTTTVAIFCGVDQLNRNEAVGLIILIAGVIMSTWGSATAQANMEPHDELELVEETTRTAVTVIAANLSFAFRAMSQKLYLLSTAHPLNGMNLMYRMLQVGAVALFLPTIVFHSDRILEGIFAPLSVQLSFLWVFCLNVLAFAIKNVACNRVLTRFSVLQFSGLNCVRRLITILQISIFFRVPLGKVGIAGLVMSFVGFVDFTYYRAEREAEESSLKRKSSDDGMKM